LNLNSSHILLSEAVDEVTVIAYCFVGN